jgi:DNA-binding MarR family transcriptional regulator
MLPPVRCIYTYMSADLDQGCWDVVTLCACEGLRRTSRAVTAHYQRELRGTGVRATQLPILVALNLMGAAAVGALADALVMDRTTLTRNLKALEAEGLVAAEADEDRRVRRLVLTAKGRGALEAALAAWRRAQTELEHAFGEDRVRALVAELGVLTATSRS